MPAEIPETPWIHIGECPECVNGLCRIRCCENERGEQHLYAMCDECEAIWLEPTTDSPSVFPDADKPLCPICAAALYGRQAHWAVGSELEGSEWDDIAIFVVPSLSAERDDIAVADDFITPDDVADSLDAPPLDPPQAAAEPKGASPDEAPSTFDMDPASDEADAAYGQDDPKPGC